MLKIFFKSKFFNKFNPILYLLPALILLLTFKILPILISFIVSFFKWDMAGPSSFVGLSNYKSVLTDSSFWQASLNTFFYALGAVPLSILLSMFFSILLHSVTKGKTFFRVLYYLPVVTSIVAVSVVWKWVYNQRAGLLNAILSLFHIQGPNWLGEWRGIFELISGNSLPIVIKGPSLALVSLIILSVWKSLGYNILIFLAGLQNIPKTYYEACEIDGANSWQKFRYITFPLLSPTTFYVFLMSTIISFQVFAPVWLMTGPPAGGPLGTTNVVVYYLYDKAFRFFHYGAASATAFILFAILLILTVLQRKFTEKRVFYG